MCYSVHFVKSHNNPIIQAADVLTFVTLKAILLKRERVPEFRKRSDKKQTWPEWTEANYSVSACHAETFGVPLTYRTLRTSGRR